MHVSIWNEFKLITLMTYNTGFDETFTDQNARPLEIEDKFNFALLIDK